MTYTLKSKVCFEQAVINDAYYLFSHTLTTEVQKHHQKKICISNGGNYNIHQTQPKQINKESKKNSQYAKSKWAYTHGIEISLANTDAVINQFTKTDFYLCQTQPDYDIKSASGTFVTMNKMLLRGDKIRHNVGKVQ